MPVTIKTPAEIEKMRVAGRLAAEVLRIFSISAGVLMVTGIGALQPAYCPGITLF